MDREIVYSLPAFEERQLDQKGDSHNVPFQASDKVNRRGHRSSRSQQVIDDQHLLTWSNRVPVNPERIRPILQVILFLKLFARKFSRLAYRNKSGTQFIGKRATQNKTPRFNRHHLFYPPPLKFLGHLTDGIPKCIPVLEKGSHVIKEYARLGKIGDLPNDLL